MRYVDVREDKMSAHDTTEPGTDATPATDERGFDRGREITETDDVFEAVDEFLGDLEEAATDEERQEIITSYLDKVSDLSLWQYSFNNIAALLTQMSNRDVDYAQTAAHFAGFNQWMNDHGRHVKEGETGYKILAPVTGWKCSECGYGKGYHPGNDWMDCEYAGEDPDEMDIDYEESNDWRHGVLFFKAVTVFAYEQTAALDDADEDEVFTPMDTEATGDATDLLPAVKQTAEGEYDLVVEIQAPENYRGRNGSMGYTRLEGHVNVLDRENEADKTRTLIHEIAHELIHGDDTDEDVDREKREVEAECVAYAVSRYFGLDADGSALYVGRWNGEDKDALKGRMRRVRKTAADLIEAIEARKN